MPSVLHLTCMQVLQDQARFLQDLTRFLQNSYKILGFVQVKCPFSCLYVQGDQDSCKTIKILARQSRFLRDLTESTEISCMNLAACMENVHFLARSCKIVFTGLPISCWLHGKCPFSCMFLAISCRKCVS